MDILKLANIFEKVAQPLRLNRAQGEDSLWISRLINAQQSRLAKDLRDTNYPKQLFDKLAERARNRYWKGWGQDVDSIGVENIMFQLRTSTKGTADEDTEVGYYDILSPEVEGGSTAYEVARNIIYKRQHP